MIELTAEGAGAAARPTRRRSSSAASIRTPASTACSATARKSGSSFRRSKRPARKGIAIEGPLPPDTAFLPWKRKATDAFVCMYHDQGHIPVKALAFDSAVNTTLGLPIIRTSVDHGTACDIAWQGKANPSSIFAAVRLALRLAK